LPSGNPKLRHFGDGEPAILRGHRGLCRFGNRSDLGDYRLLRFDITRHINSQLLLAEALNCP
jgi:hypothetical protein